MQNALTVRNTLTSGQTPNGASHDPHSAILPVSSGYLAGFPILAIETGEALTFDNSFWLNPGIAGKGMVTALNGASGTIGGAVGAVVDIGHTAPPVAG